MKEFKFYVVKPILIVITKRPLYPFKKTEKCQTDALKKSLLFPGPVQSVALKPLI